MDVLARLSWVDVAIIALLAVGVFIGFTQGIIRYLLSVLADATGPVGAYYNALDDSLIVGFLRETVIPGVGFVARPFVPREIAQLLLP